MPSMSSKIVKNVFAFLTLKKMFYKISTVVVDYIIKVKQSNYS